MTTRTDVDAAGAAALIKAVLTGSSTVDSASPSVTLLGHVQPDADALGSALGLALPLRALGASVRVSFGEPAEVPDSLRFLDSESLVVTAADVPDVADLLVVLDCSAISRLGPLESTVDATVAAGGSVLVLDHHVGGERFGTHHLIDETAEATAVLVLRVLDALGVEPTEPVARCLYAGLMTDTGSFHRADGNTHRMAARLIDAGADPEWTVRQMGRSRSYGWLTMVSAALGRSRLEPDAAGGAGLVVTEVLRADVADGRGEDADSVVGLLRAVGEADVAAVLKENADGTWSVSLRSSTVDVNAVAVALGGGGHLRASGFTTTGTADEVLDRLRAALTP